MLNYLKREKVLDISWVLAIITMFFIRPDRKYIDYIDFKVLALLFCLMLVVKGFQRIGLFALLIEKVSIHIKDSRSLSQMLVFVCFFFSMLITNDVALITFVPFAILSLKLCKQEELMIRVIVLQTIAANLGSMFTPIGNPQNLYLFSVSGMGVKEFFETMLPLTVLSFVLILAVTFMIPKKRIHINIDEKIDTSEKTELIAYSILFVVNLLVVFRILSWIPVLILTILTVLLIKRQELLKQVDYALLLTFVGFFIFVGNIGRIPWFSEILEQIIQGREILVAAVFSQFLSNVPAALLLSGFTDDFAGLLMGTNIGGLGTLIASMASLISYKLYAKTENSRKGKYMAVFTGYNLVGLIILLLFALI
ncbi:MAG: SLC13 family permease [Schaedlerella sp.]|nr:SLC13 family permease [Schaedlerella sp.]